MSWLINTFITLLVLQSKLEGKKMGFLQDGPIHQNPSRWLTSESLLSVQGQTSNSCSWTHQLSHAHPDCCVLSPTEHKFPVVCVCLCPMPRLPEASRGIKRILHHVQSHLALFPNNHQNRVAPPPPQAVHVYTHTQWPNDTHMKTSTHKKLPPSAGRSCRALGLRCNLSRSFSGEKHGLSFHFSCAPSHSHSPLPPLDFLAQQHVSLRRLLCWNHRPHPVLWQQPCVMLSEWVSECDTAEETTGAVYFTGSKHMEDHRNRESNSS